MKERSDGARMEQNERSVVAGGCSDFIHDLSVRRPTAANDKS